jgi:hypothetical protein
MKDLVQEMPQTLQREHLPLQKMKFINCFLFLGPIFACLDPDPRTQLNPDPIRIRIRNIGFKELYVLSGWLETSF